MTSLQFRCLFTVIRTAGLTQPRFELGWHFPSEALTRSLSHFTAQRNGGAGVNQHRRCSSKRSGITGGFCPPDMEGLWKGECSAWAAPPELGGLLLSTHVDGEELLKTQSAFYSPAKAGVGEISWFCISDPNRSSTALPLHEDLLLPSSGTEVGRNSGRFLWAEPCPG